MPKYIKDINYTLIEVSDLALQFIDTPEFQRLRRIRQLSTCYLVFPSTNHTRFEHSLGVYHLTGLMLMHLNRKIDERLCEIIKIAGLCHDVGHMAFSHTFDHHIIPKLKNANILKDHESRSIMLIRHMIKKYSIDITDEEMEIIECAIYGKYHTNYPKYLFQVVCNNINGIDTDKMDYLTRDTYYIKQTNVFDPLYIINFSKIIDNEICFNDKCLIPIYKMFNLRYTLHKELYQHDVAVSTEFMIRDLILANREHLDLDNCHKDFKWLEITDDIIYRLKNKEILEKIERRQLYKIRYESDGLELFTITRTFSFSSIEECFNYIYFYKNKESDKKFIMNALPEVFPCKYAEKQKIFVYSY